MSAVGRLATDGFHGQNQSALAGPGKRPISFRPIVGRSARRSLFPIAVIPSRAGSSQDVSAWMLFIVALSYPCDHADDAIHFLGTF